MKNKDFSQLLLKIIEMDQQRYSLMLLWEQPSSDSVWKKIEI